LPYQRHSSSANYARELFKPLKDSPSLLVYTGKQTFVWVCRFLVSDIISDAVLGQFWLMLPGLRPNC